MTNRVYIWFKLQNHLAPHCGVTRALHAQLAMAKGGRARAQVPRPARRRLGLLVACYCPLNRC